MSCSEWIGHTLAVGHTLYRCTDDGPWIETFALLTVLFVNLLWLNSSKNHYLVWRSSQPPRSQSKVYSSANMNPVPYQVSNIDTWCILVPILLKIHSWVMNFAAPQLARESECIFKSIWNYTWKMPPLTQDWYSSPVAILIAMSCTTSDLSALVCWSHLFQYTMHKCWF